VRPFDLTAEYHTRRKFTTGKKGPVTRGILPHFRSNKEGVIIKVGSGAGILTLPMISLYCASKFALEGFSKALAYELASQNIVVKLVEPHGGVASTSFNERSARDQAKDPSLKDYDEFVPAPERRLCPDVRRANAQRGRCGQSDLRRSHRRNRPTPVPGGQ